MNQPPHESHTLNRRSFLITAASAATAAAIAPDLAGAAEAKTVATTPGVVKPRIYKSLKFGMFNEKLPIAEKFKILKDLGFDGVELNAPHGPDKEECLAASQATGLKIDGTVNDVHWKIRMTDPKPEVRAKSTGHMLEAIRQCHRCGGHTVLLVPGHGRDGSIQQVEDRSIAEIQKCLPLCAELGVAIAIENVWNAMLYDPKGPDNQSADRFATYVDRINSPWVGMQFDIGNHQRFGKPAEWIRTLGRRIIKLDVKDWGKANGFCKIGDGDVAWDDVCQALADIGYHGWAAAEVGGGDRKRMAEVAANMDKVFNF